MNKNTLKLAGLALAAAFAISARADVSIHQNVSAYGYAAGSIRYNQPNANSSDTTMDLDAAKLGLAFNFAPLTAKVSLYTPGNSSDNKIYLLEANATYDIGNGLSATGGRFQSWIGYEAFDIPNGNFITNGADAMSFIIPNFHEGVKLDYTFEKSTVGIAFVDSIFNTGTSSNPNDNKYRGDGSLSNGYGIEARYAYNDGAFSLNGTLAYQNQRDESENDTYIADLWAQYVIKKTTYGAELYYSYNHSDSAQDGYNTWYGLVMVKQQMSEKFTLAGRLSGGKIDDANFWKISVEPAYAVTQNLSVGAELNYAKYNHDFRYEYVAGNAKSNFFAGVQACFKF